MGRVFITLKQLKDGCLHALSTRFARWTKPVMATKEIYSHKRCLKGGVVVVKQALFEWMVHVASTGITAFLFSKVSADFWFF